MNWKGARGSEQGAASAGMTELLCGAAEREASVNTSWPSIFGKVKYVRLRFWGLTSLCWLW